MVVRMILLTPFDDYNYPADNVSYSDILVFQIFASGFVEYSLPNFLWVNETEDLSPVYFTTIHLLHELIITYYSCRTINQAFINISSFVFISKYIK